MEFKQHPRHEFHLNFLATEFTLQGRHWRKEGGRGSKGGPWGENTGKGKPEWESGVAGLHGRRFFHILQPIRKYTLQTHRQSAME